MSATSKVSFTVRRPTPDLSRPSSTGPESDGQFKVPALPRLLAGASSATGSPLATSREGSDDDGETGIVFSKDGTTRGNGGGELDDASDDDGTSVEEDLITEFDQFSVQRASNKKSKAPVPASLVIPSLPNPDWREAARKRRAAAQSNTLRSRSIFVPDSARATTGADGSVGGLGTRDTINSGPQLVGLQVSKREKIGPSEGVVEQTGTTTTAVTESTDEHSMEVEETEDQRAIRALLAGEDGSSVDIDAIPIPAVTETDALLQDVDALPDCATAEDYARVPVSAFGVAMLRGMGWTEGTAASKSDKGKKHGLVEPYLPQARPALLGIGAKEQESLNDGSGKHQRKSKDRRYIPVVRKDGREESGSSRSGTVSRRASRSPPGRAGDEYARSRSRYDRDYSERSDRDGRRDYDDREKDKRGGNGYRDRERRERDERDYESRRRKDYREDSDRNRHSRRDGRR
ncbi:DExH-box splicing factor binding site-domain-containing protein [Pisolithus orientalis]|uniref:DExH-box splicing factor binding site-domain-containing protein n=1 Tax=Pisolithus orientalis TaxID=936130 RepID=UPI002224F37A|nr:DExH-box splicing factor binding site-domain-containing protein [Pisolithus orientalis]KAI6030634.1 DExH-box splicing factor binding site-domain-containing protein [Pisolithus orientalis]